MEVLWRASPASTEEIVAALAGKHSWEPSTIKTLVNRLLGKRAISAKKDRRRYLYSPVLKREDWMSVETKGLLDRVFGGRVAPLVAHFSKHRKLTRRDVEELKRLIEDMDHGR